MGAPAVLFATAELFAAMDDKVRDQMCNVAALPGIVLGSFAMPDAHWGYGFPIGGIAAFDPQEGGVVSAGGVGFDIACGVRALRLGVRLDDVRAKQPALAEALFEAIPAGVGSSGAIHLEANAMDAMLAGGAHWAVAQGWGDAQDLAFIEEGGRIAGAEPGAVSSQARARQRDQMGTLGSGNHYLEVQHVTAVHDAQAAEAFGIAEGDAVLSIHCGSRGLGHQIGTEFGRAMVAEAPNHGLTLPERQLACAPLESELGRRYLGAMRAAMNCAIANRQILTELARRVLARVLPKARLSVLYDVSHNTCKEEEHAVGGRSRRLFVHRKGATRAFGPGHRELPERYRAVGQPVLIGGSMGTASYVLTGTASGMARAFGSACHGAGRAFGRNEAAKRWNGRQVVDELASRGILVRSPSTRGIAEEAPGAFTAELSTCQLYIFDATRHPSDMEFLKEGVWHEGSATNLRIGGMLTQLDARLRPQGRSYECRMRDGRVIDWAMR